MEEMEHDKDLGLTMSDYETLEWDSDDMANVGNVYTVVKLGNNR